MRGLKPKSDDYDERLKIEEQELKMKGLQPKSSGYDEGLKTNSKFLTGRASIVQHFTARMVRIT